MSKCFSFVVFFATFFAVTAEEFDPRDYMKDGYNAMEYRRILPDKPMLANYAAILTGSDPTFIFNINYSNNLAPYISDITIYQTISMKKEHETVTHISRHNAYVLYYSKDALAEKQYKFDKDRIMSIPSLNPNEITDEDNVSLVKNNKKTLAYISENFIYELQAGISPELKNGKLVTKQRNLAGNLANDIPLTDFAKKNQNSKDTLNLLDFDSSIIYFSVHASEICGNIESFRRIFAPEIQEKENFKFKEYVQYLSTAVSYDEKTNKCRIIFSVLCDTPESAKELYDSAFGGKDLVSHIFFFCSKMFTLDFKCEISGRKVSAITEIESDQLFESAKNYYETYLCANRIGEIIRTITTYAKTNDGKYPTSLQQLDIQNLIINPLDLTCPSSGAPYIYLASGETLDSMEDMPLIMDRNPNGNHFHMNSYTWSYMDSTDQNKTWHKRLLDLSKINREKAAQFIRKKLTDYEKINIDAE